MALYTYRVVLVFDTKTRSACWEDRVFVCCLSQNYFYNTHIIHDYYGASITWMVSLRMVYTMSC